MLAANETMDGFSHMNQYGIKEMMYREGRDFMQNLMKERNELFEMYREDGCLSNRILEKLGPLDVREREDAFGSHVGIPADDDDPFRADLQQDIIPEGKWNDRLTKECLVRELLSRAAAADDRDTFSGLLERCDYRVTCLRMIPIWKNALRGLSLSQVEWNEWFSIVRQEQFPHGAYITEKESWLKQIRDHDAKVESWLDSNDIHNSIPGPVWLCTEKASMVVNQEREYFFYESSEIVPALLALDRKLLSVFKVFDTGLHSFSGCTIFADTGDDTLISHTFESAWDLLLDLSANDLFWAGKDAYRKLLDEYLAYRKNREDDMSWLQWQKILMILDNRIAALFLRYFGDCDSRWSYRLKDVLKDRNDVFLKHWITHRGKRRGCLDRFLTRYETDIRNSIFRWFESPDKRSMIRLKSFYQTLFGIIHTDNAWNAARRMLLNDAAELITTIYSVEESREIAIQQMKPLLDSFCQVPDISIYLEKELIIRSCAPWNNDYYGWSGEVPMRLMEVARVFQIYGVGQAPYPVDLYADSLRTEPEEEEDWPDSIERGRQGRSAEVKTIMELLQPLRITDRADPVTCCLLINGTVSQIRNCVKKGFLTQKNAPALLKEPGLSDLAYERKVFLMQLCGERESVFSMLRL